MNTKSRFALAAVAGLGAAAFAVPAFAADVVYQEPPAPAPIFEPAPIASWEGAYIGAHAGYGFGGRVQDSAGGQVRTNGWLGGVFGGYNFQNGQIVYGLEGDVNISGVDGTNAAGAQARSSVDGSIRARVGVAVTDDVLVYGTAGGAAERLRVTTPGGSTDRNNMFGYTVGAGVDARLTEQVFARAEYRYTDYGSKTFNFPGVGADRIDSSNHRVTVGLGFKF